MIIRLISAILYQQQYNLQNLYLSDVARIKIHKNGQLINSVAESNNLDNNLNEINLINFSTRKENNNSININNDNIDIKISKNNNNKFSIKRQFKEQKGNADRGEKMDDE